MSTEAWVTLSTGDSYALGCLTLAHSLRSVNTTRKLHCLITDGVSPRMREQLGTVYDEVSIVNVLDSGDNENLELIGRPELGVTFTKMHCWRLTQYTKCVFLDADALVVQNCDELFDHDELSAVSDVGWPDIFNSGMFVFRPSLETYRGLLQFALEFGSFDGGDQGLLNAYFCDWRMKDCKYRLSFVYNMVVGVIYTYSAAFKRFGNGVKIVHFLGAIKPWQETYQCNADGTLVDPKIQEADDNTRFNQLWWWIFVNYAQRDMPTELNPLAISAPTGSSGLHH